MKPPQLQMIEMPGSTQTRATIRCPDFPHVSSKAADQDNYVSEAERSCFMDDPVYSYT